MLFLLNSTIVEVDAPELYVAKHWRRIGCGDPAAMRASDAVDFSIMVVNDVTGDGLALDAETATDLAALIIAKTGANAALFDGNNTAKLNVLPEVVLQGLQRELSKGGVETIKSFWASAA